MFPDTRAEALDGTAKTRCRGIPASLLLTIQNSHCLATTSASFYEPPCLWYHPMIPQYTHESTRLDAMRSSTFTPLHRKSPKASAVLEYQNARASKGFVVQRQRPSLTRILKTKGKMYNTWLLIKSCELVFVSPPAQLTHVSEPNAAERA